MSEQYSLDFGKNLGGSFKFEPEYELFDSLYQVEKKNFTITSVGSGYDYKVLESLHRKITSLYDTTTANRHHIVFQLAKLLEEDTPLGVIKLDIASFYESIDRKQILTELFCEARLSIASKSKLKQLFENDIIRYSEGLPRGINISAVLAELFMKEFDKKVQQVEGVYYYARYVDDIIIVTWNNPTQVFEKVVTLLPSSLNLNQEKTLTPMFVGCQCQKTPKEELCPKKKKCDCHKKCVGKNDFEYLGYRFIFPDYPTTEKGTLKIRIAQSKIQKIKTRIVLSLKAGAWDDNFRTLQKRIQFLTSNYTIHKATETQKGSLRGGIYYNYPLLTDTTDLEELNIFLRKCVYSSSKFFGLDLSRKQKKILASYSFCSGYADRRHFNFTRKELNRITRCWINE